MHVMFFNKETLISRNILFLNCQKSKLNLKSYLNFFIIIEQCV